MNKSIIFLIITLLAVCSFGQTEGYRQNENELYFKFYQKNEGKTAQIGELGSLHMVITNEQGEEIKNSYSEKEGKPVLFPVKISTFPGDIYEAVGMMSAGDSASFLIPADSIYQKVFRKALPANVKSGTFLNFTIKILLFSQLIEKQQVRITVVHKHSFFDCLVFFLYYARTYVSCLVFKNADYNIAF